MSRKLTIKEYMDFIEKIVRDEADEFNDIDMGSWIPSEPIKKPPIRYGSKDLTTAKKSEILKAIKSNEYINIGDFVISINEDKDKHVRMKIMEHTYKTITGKPCNIIITLDVTKDSRFASCDWKNLFSENLPKGKISMGKGLKTGIIPEEKIADILRWIQAVNKLKAFL